MQSKFSKFHKSVRAGFAYLETEFGCGRFEPHQHDNLLQTKYINESIFVWISLGPPAYEISLSFGRCGIDDRRDRRPFDVGDLMLLNETEDWIWKALPNESKIDASIREYARLLFIRGNDCLIPKPEVYAKMIQNRKVHKRNWLLEENDRALRNKAKKAWDAKEYSDAFDAFATIKGPLKQSELKK